MNSSPLAFATRQRAANVRRLATRLANTENALCASTAHQVDAVTDLAGQTYLLRPAQEQLRRSEARLQALFKSSPDVITVINRGGVIICESPATKRLLGYEPDEIAGKSLFDFIHNDDLAHFHSAFLNVIEEFHSEATVQFRHRTREGPYRVLEASVSKLRDGAGMSVILICRDTTRRTSESVRLEGRVSETSRASERLLALLAHELRTPLTAALLGIQALQEDEHVSGAAALLAMVRRNIELQSHLLEKLLDFTHIVQGKVRPKLESLDAHTTIRNVLETCHCDIVAKQIDVRLHLDAEKYYVRADAIEFQQILMNLLRTGVKFSEAGGILEIATSNFEPVRLTIEIRDQGVGIEPSLLPFVFDSFQQGDAAMQQRYGGLGLGLFIAKSLAEVQQGTLTATSEGRGKGATFRLSLGLAEPDLRTEVALTSPPVNGRRILLVEDHADTGILLARLLEHRGHTVFAANDTASALRLAATGDFDVLISDIRLPDGTGHELMQRLRRTQPGLPGIAMSGFNTPFDIARSREAGFSHYLVKPVALDSLQLAIEAIAANRSRETVAGYRSEHEDNRVMTLLDSGNTIAAPVG
jgi:two-component system CheB/CheR fusion protein